MLYDQTIRAPNAVEGVGDRLAASPNLRIGKCLNFNNFRSNLFIVRAEIQSLDMNILYL